MIDRIHDVGYRSLPRPRPHRWAPWPIARTALAMALRRRSTRLAGMFAAFVVFMHGSVIIGQVLVDRATDELAERDPMAGMAAELATGIIGRVHETLSVFLGVQMFVTALLLAVIAAPLVADDRRTRAFELYFSRPLSLTDYALGKLLVAASVPLTTIVIPFVLLWLLAVGISPADVADGLFALLAPGLVAALLSASMLATTVLGASALGDRGRTVGVAYLIALVLVSAFADALAESGQAWGGYLGPQRNIQTVADALLRVSSHGLLAETLLTTKTNPSAWISAAVLLGLVAAGLGVLVARLRREVAG